MISLISVSHFDGARFVFIIYAYFWWNFLFSLILSLSWEYCFNFFRAVYISVLYYSIPRKGKFSTHVQSRRHRNRRKFVRTSRVEHRWQKRDVKLPRAIKEWQHEDEKMVRGSQMIRRCKRIWLWCNRVLFDVTVVRRIAMSAIILCLFYSVLHSRNRFSRISLISFVRISFLLDIFVLSKERK